MDSPLPLRERYRQELVVRGLAARTVDAYVRAVVLMVDRTGLHPARMSEDDARAYLASLVETHGCAESTYRQHATGLVHFFKWVLGRSFAVLDAARPRRRSRLPEVLTLPSELRAVTRSHQRELLASLFQAAAEAVQTLATDRLGGRLGMIAFHTWGRNLAWHPHLTCTSSSPAWQSGPTGRT